MSRYILGNKEYKTKKDIEAKCQEIVSRVYENEYLVDNDYDFVYDLFQLHPNCKEKSRDGIAGFIVERDKLYGKGKHFCVVRKDESKIDFSWKKCIAGKQTNKRRLVLDAMRRAIQAQIFEYANDQFRVTSEIICPITYEPVTRDNCHVDHVYPNTFSYLSQKWIDDNNLTYEIIELKNSEDGYGYVFSDAELLKRWQVFHFENAELRILSISGNMSISDKEGKNMITFEERYNVIYRKAFEFHKRHDGAKTQDEYRVAAREAGATFTDAFEAALAAAIYNEIGRMDK